ncbi:DUF1559 domain-containing protein [Aeoliella sp. ICT_H6.2]|uniref:DUF1559 domain-containing protein n=1 Tax=Aeoliella straminimaris TaxID=2954799 RepID=A0A9X2F8Z5_9BACT|nr:DUF1559 domain-containing protein [Aeoliella straminimaris]MCO6043853.1 DUF1559 domain-containing protein [Aeoliella straminimaris]
MTGRHANPDEHPQAGRHGLSTPGVRVLLAVTAVIVLVFLLVPAAPGPRVHPESWGCQNNLRQLAVALINYESTRGEFPPAYTVDDAGNRLHSWRSLLLPYLDRPDLCERIDFKKPWDDPVNAEVLAAMPEVYRCPGLPGSVDASMTTYCVVVGPEFVFKGADGTRVDDLLDGANETLLVVEVSSDHAVQWMSPEDIDEQTILQLLQNKKVTHPGRLIAAYADGRIESLPLELQADELHDLLTIAGEKQDTE